MKAYKVFNNDWTCRGFKFEVGKKYTYEGKIEMCGAGFHACRELHNCFKFYPCVPWNKIAEVELGGEILGENEEKQCASEIKVIKEIPFEKIGEIIKNNHSNGINYSDGVDSSNGVNSSDGVNSSRGVNSSYGVLNSFGVSKSLFTADIKSDYLFFNKKITKKRWEKINSEFREILNGWYPEFNNLKSLYLKSGSNWSKTPIPMAEEISKKEAWKDMPKEAINYLKKQRGFDAKIFKKITGIDA